MQTAQLHQPAPAAEVPIFLKTAEAAALLNVAPRTLEQDRIRNRWRVPFVKIGASVRYDRAEVLRWLSERNTVKAGPT